MAEPLPAARGQWLRFALKIGVSMALAVACLAAVESKAMVTAFTGLSLDVLLLVALITLLGGIVIPALITKLALRGERIHLSLRELIAINLAVRFYVLVLPRPLSMAIRWLRYRAGGPGSDAAALIVFERVVQLLVISLVAFVFLGMDQRSLPAAGDALGLIVAPIVLVLLGLFAMFLSPSVYRRVDRVRLALHGILPRFLRDKAEKLSQSVAAFQGIGAGTILAIMVLSCGAFICFVLGPYLLAQDMALGVSLVGLAWIRSLVFLLTLVPVTIGGIGLREAGFVALLPLYGVPASEALAFSLVILAIQLGIGAVGAACEVWRHWLQPSLAPRIANSDRRMGPA